MSEIIIIGSGPAGISASLYTARAGIKTTVIGKDSGALEKAEKIQNFYGLPEPITGKELAENGISQAKMLGVQIIKDEVVGIEFYGNVFVVQTPDSSLSADSVILATGSSRNTPNVKGLAEFEGKGVSYCAVCDAFFYRGKDVAVLGNGDYAAHEIGDLISVVKSVILLTDGGVASSKLPLEVKIIADEIDEFLGNEILESVKFKNGSSVDISGVFIAMGVAGSAAFAKKLGAQTDGNNIVVDENMRTNIPGLFAAGDCVGGMLQIAKAVYQGAVAGTEAVKYLRKK